MLKRNLILVIPLILLLNGCATLPKTLTAKQQMTIWMETYNQEFDDTMNVMMNPQASEAQKNVARQKKQILIQLWPLLKACSIIADNGQEIPQDEVVQINNLINQLTTTALNLGGH